MSLFILAIGISIIILSALILKHIIEIHELIHQIYLNICGHGDKLSWLQSIDSNLEKLSKK